MQRTNWRITAPFLHTGQISAIFTGAGNSYLKYPYTTRGTDKNRIATSFPLNLIENDAMLSMSTSFSTIMFDENVVGKSQVEHIFAASLDIIIRFKSIKLRFFRLFKLK